MNSKDSEDKLKRHANRSVDQGIEDLNSAELDRLAQARQSALNSIPVKTQRHSWHSLEFLNKPYWLGGIASAAVILAVGFLFNPSPTTTLDTHPELAQNAQEPSEMADLAEIEDLEVLLSEVELELLEDELEFYSWVEEEVFES